MTLSTDRRGVSPHHAQAGAAPVCPEDHERECLEERFIHELGEGPSMFLALEPDITTWFIWNALCHMQEPDGQQAGEPFGSGDPTRERPGFDSQPGVSPSERSEGTE